MTPRDKMWGQLERTFDVLVIGAGIIGSGVAREAARRGLRVALLDQYDIAYGTSSRSSKLVHGGLRYLEQLRFGLVFESVQERRVLQRIAPHLVRPLAFLFPIYVGSKVTLWLLRLGMWVYDVLSLFRSPRLHRVLSPRNTIKTEPGLRAEGLKGAPLYYDCATDDARLTLETAIDAAFAGTVVVPQCKVVALHKDNTGRVARVEVEDNISKRRQSVSARIVVNATGPWTDATLALDAEGAAPLLELTKGVHIAVRHVKLPLHHAVTCFHPQDQRVLFAIPWGDLTYVGTTDTPYEGNPEEVHAELQDVNYLLAATRVYFPSYPLTTEDVVTTWAGLRPLIRPKAQAQKAPSSISREHEIYVGNDGVVTVAGGKLTTYRLIAKQTVNTLGKELRRRDDGKLPTHCSRTDRNPLPGAVGLSRHVHVVERVQQDSQGSVSSHSAHYLVEMYGQRALEIAALCAKHATLATPLVAGRPEILAQVYWAVEEEFATALSDFFVRRTQLFFRDVHHGLTALDAVTAMMSKLLEWSPQQAAEQQAQYRAYVELHQSWKAELSVSSP